MELFVLTIELFYDKFDVVGEITFSKRLGFLEEGRDVEDIMASIWHWFEYVAIVGLPNNKKTLLLH